MVKLATVLTKVFASARTTNTRPADVGALLDGGALLVDVRTFAEYRSGHVTGSRNIPLDQLARRVDELPADKPILTFCRSGARSARAARLLRRHGRTAINVRGGMIAWQSAGLPIRTARR